MPRKKTAEAKPDVEPASEEQKPLVVEGAIRWVSVPRQPDHAEVTPLGLELVRQLATRGHNLVSIATHMGISGKTLRAAMKRQPEVEDALEVGKAILDHDIHDALYRQGMKGCFQALMFLAKCRLGWRETEAPNTKPNITIGHLHLPDSKSPEEFVRSITTQGEPAALPEPKEDAK